MIPVIKKNVMKQTSFAVKLHVKNLSVIKVFHSDDSHKRKQPSWIYI